MAAAAPHISSFPSNVLHHILLTATTHDNLLRFVAACARVCAEWWRVVGGSAAYGRGLSRGRRGDLPYFLRYEGGDNERARVLKAISAALEQDGHTLRLRDRRIGDGGAAPLAAALLALRRRYYQSDFQSFDLGGNNLSAAGIAALRPALRRPWRNGLRCIDLAERNRWGVDETPAGLGDAGVVALAGALPPTLEQLHLRGAGCGDDAFAALAAALPALTRLRTLDCGSNPVVGDRGWVALAGALPSARSLRKISAVSCTDLGAEGAAALAAALPECAVLRVLDLLCVEVPEPANGQMLAWYRSLTGGEKSLTTGLVRWRG